MSKSKVFCFLSCVLLLVVLILPSSASPSPDDSLILTYPLNFDNFVSPLTLSSDYYVHYGFNIDSAGYKPLSELSISSQPITDTTTDWVTYRAQRQGVSGRYYASWFFGIGIHADIAEGSTVSLSWSDFTNSNRFSSGSVTSGISFDNNPVTLYTEVPYSLYDESFNLLGGPFSSSGSYSLTLDHPISSLIFGFYTTSSSSFSSSTTGSIISRISNSPSSLSYSVSVPPTLYELVEENNSLLSSGNSTRSHIDSDMHQVITILQDMSTSAANDPMSQFEGKYLEQMGDQLTGVEGMMSSSNPALPNGGDFVGFADDMQKGFGVNGSSFNPSDFSSAAGSFSGSSSTAEGGPWEFFSQSVADSLAGGASSIGLDDDDYIYAWLEQSERRYGLWASFNP